MIFGIIISSLVKRLRKHKQHNKQINDTVVTVSEYILFLKEDFTYNGTITLKAGTIIYSQKSPWNIEQITETKAKGFPYQWGFGSCYERFLLKNYNSLKLRT